MLAEAAWLSPATRLDVPRAKVALREAGRPDLAARLGRLSKGRNSAAHPDYGLVFEVRSLRGSAAEVRAPAAELPPAVSVAEATNSEKELFEEELIEASKVHDRDGNGFTTSTAIVQQDSDGSDHSTVGFG